MKSLGVPISTVAFTAAFLYSIFHSESFPKYSTYMLIVSEILILLFCEFGPLSNFGARKLCHSFSGFMMLHLNSDDPIARYFVYSVAVSSLVMVWEIGINFRFRYAKPRDVGISVYLIIVVLFFYHRIPLEVIKPVFFADPLGALVGRYLSEQVLLFQVFKYIILNILFSMYYNRDTGTQDGSVRRRSVAAQLFSLPP